MAKQKKGLSCLWWIGYLIILVGVAVFYGLNRIENVDFICTNGDYQNYNAFRRFLAGQIPYKDFTNYLGMGPILLCTPLLSLHNTFAGSLFVTNFVAAACFIVLTTVLFYFVTGDKRVSMLAGLVCPKLISSGLTMLIPVYGYYVTYYVGTLVAPGNSFRPVRMFLPTLFCLVAMGCLKFLHRKEPDTTLRSLVAKPKGAAFLGFVVGFGITWSNDFGFACIGSVTLVLLILTIADVVQNNTGAVGSKRWINGFSRFLWYIPALLLGMFCSALLASQGHLGSYLEFTTGTAGWQFWYFGCNADEKICSLADLFNWTEHRRTLIHLGVYLVAMGVCLYRLCRRKDNDRLILFVFLYTSFLAGQYLYILGSGVNGFDEGVIGFTTLMYIALLCKGFLWLIRKAKLMPLIQKGLMVALVCYGVTVLYADYSRYQYVKTLDLKNTDSNYVAELEGVTQDAPALREMAQIVGDAPLFSTYATALDDMLGNFHPAGSDYIIHALGDTGFARYMSNFVEGEYPFVQTTNFNRWPWEGWTACATWDFYRELFSNYNVHSDHGVWTLWEYAGEDANVLQVATTVQIVRLDDNRTEIRVTADTDQTCYVDVLVEWENAYVMNLYRLQTWHNAVFIAYSEGMTDYKQIAGDGYYRPASGRMHLVVFVENGVGSIVLESVPKECTVLTVSEATVTEVIRFQR